MVSWKPTSLPRAPEWQPNLPESPACILVSTSSGWRFFLAWPNGLLWIPRKYIISSPASKQNQISFDSTKCRWILQSKSALSGWCEAVTFSWHNIIWNDIEQHAFGTKLLAGFSFDSRKFIALIPRSFNPLWHKLRLALLQSGWVGGWWGEGEASILLALTLPLYLKLLLTIYAHTSDTHFEWQNEGGREKDLLE